MPVFSGAIIVVDQRIRSDVSPGLSRLLWSWRRRPRVIKATTNTPLLYISCGQCWITKTCHHETPDLDWFLLPSAVCSNFELPKPPATIFFCTCWMRKVWEGSDQKSCLLSLPKKWCKELHDECFTAGRRLHLVYLSASSGRWSSSDRCTTKHWIQESERIWHNDRRQEKLEAFSFSKVFVTCCQQNPCHLYHRVDKSYHKLQLLGFFLIYCFFFFATYSTVTLGFRFGSSLLPGCFSCLPQSENRH